MAGARLVLALIAAAALAAGCGSATRAPRRALAARHPNAVTVPAPPGYRTHRLTSAGVSIALPIGWQVLAQRDAVFPGVREILTRLDRSFALPLAELGSPDSPLKLFAFDRSFARGRPTTIQVVQATYARPGGYDSWAPRMAAALRHAPGLRGAVAIAGVQLPAGLALRGIYRTITHDTVYAPTPRAVRDGRVLAQAASSFQAFQPVGGPSPATPSAPGA